VYSSEGLTYKKYVVM